MSEGGGVPESEAQCHFSPQRGASTRANTFQDLKGLWYGQSLGTRKSCVSEPERQVGTNPGPATEVLNEVEMTP